MNNLGSLKTEFTGTWLAQKRIVHTLADSGEASRIPYVAMRMVEQVLRDTYHELPEQ